MSNQGRSPDMKLCSLATATPRKRLALGAWFSRALHDSVFNCPTDDKQRQGCRRLTGPTGKFERQVGIGE